MLVEDQSEVLAFLSRPETFTSDAPVTRFDTHISAVFLVGARAYKLKRAVRFSYVDFSTAEKRHRACLNEIAFNRRTAPELYLGVIPITRTASGALVLDGTGEPVDWLVEMVRFSQRGLFSNLAEQKALKRSDMEELAAIIAEFHAIAKPRTNISGSENLGNIITSNVISLQSAPPGLFDPDQIEAFNRQTEKALTQVAGLLDERSQTGRIRHCHGDLHLANICRIEGASGEPPRTVLFDCIEFSLDFATIDVLYDLAFLVMDLLHIGERRLASILFNRYMDLTDEVKGLAGWPLFLSVRAAIRAHVGGAALAILKSLDQQSKTRRQSHIYLHQALAYLSPGRPRLIAVGGLSGGGKSRMARELAPYLDGAPGALVLRTDILRKRLAGIPILTALGPEHYGPEMGRKTYDHMFEKARQALQAGHPVICDAVFAKPEERAAIEQIAHEMATPFDGLWVDASLETRLQRIDRRKNNPSDATKAIARKQSSYDLGDISWPRIDSGGPREATLAAGLRALALQMC